MRPAAEASLSDAVAWAVVEHAADGIVVVDDEGQIVLANGQLAELFGYPQAELVGQPVELLVPETVRAAHRGHRQGYRAEPQPRPMGADVQLSGRHRDGSELPVEISLSPLVDAGRQLVVAVVRDVADRRRAQAHRRQVQQALDATLDGVYLFDLTTLEFTYVNHGAAVQSGYPREQLLASMGPVQLSAELTEADFQELLTPLLAGEAASVELATVLRRRDGQHVPVEVVLQCPALDDDGARWGVAVVRDVSKRRAAEQRLQQELDHKAALVEALDDGLVETDTTGRVVEASERLCEMVGRPREQVVGAAPPHPWLADDQQGGLEEALRELIPARRGHVTAQLVRDDGSRLAVEAAVSPVTRPGTQADGRLWLVRDITDRILEAQRLQAAEQQLARAEDQERIARDLHDLVIQDLFAAGLSLQGVAGRLGDARAAARVHEVTDMLDAAVRSIRSVIFGLSRRDTGDAQGLRAAVLDIADDASRILGFSPKVRFDGPVDLAVDQTLADHVVAVVHEALSNVACHAHASRVDIELTVTDQLLLRIADDGRGLGGQPPSGGRGLGNLASRAAAVGGQVDTGPGPHGGTVVEWGAPVSDVTG